MLLLSRRTCPSQATFSVHSGASAFYDRPNRPISTVDPGEAFVPLDHYATLLQHEVVAGDLLIAGLGDESHPLGRACVAPAGLGPAIVKADCYRVRLDQGKVCHEWAALAISSRTVTSATRVLSRGSTRARINTEIARDIAIPIPSLETQARLVIQHGLDRQPVMHGLEELGRSSRLLRERKQALITAAVTGEFDVRTAMARDVA